MSLPPPPGQTPPGWYHDGTDLRWWDGSQWGMYAWQHPYGQGWAPARDEVADGRGMALLAHLGILIFAAVVAAIIRGTSGKNNRFVREQATEALNFQLTWLLLYFVVYVPSVIGMSRASGSGGPWLIGIGLVIVLGITFVVLAIIAAVKAYRGVRYRYPFAIRFFKP